MKTASIVVSALAAALLAAQAAARPSPQQHLNVVVERDVEIPMRDGTLLRSTLFRPDAGGRFPALVYRTPYSQEDYAAEPDFPIEAARRGYLVFLVDVRGRYRSDGEFEAYRNEKVDGYDTVEWIAAHRRCDGKVGSWGGSYPGYVQWLALSQAPPHYAAAVPTMTPTSSHHFFYQGGAFNLTWFDWFLPLIVPDLRRRAGDSSGPWEYEEAYEEWSSQRRARYLERPLVGVPLLRRYAPYYYDWLEHPDDDGWWRFADIEADFERIRAPTLLVTGWYDNNYGPVGATRGFRGMRERAATAEAREHTKLWIGPWTHTDLRPSKTRFGDLDFGPSAGIDFDAALLRWFDARLRGIPNGLDAEPPVRIFVMGRNEWRFASDWPPPGAVSTPLYLASDGDARTDRGDGRLEWDPPRVTADADAYTFDPQNPVWDEEYERSGALSQEAFESRSDTLVYTTPPLARDMEVTGELAAELWISVDRPDTDLAVRVTDVHPDGTSYVVFGPEAGYLRLRYRDGFERQRLLTPGAVTRIRIGDMLTSNVFRAGHRIRLQVTSSRAPHFDPNPNTGDAIASATQLVPARVTVWHDAERPSRLWLPLMAARAASSAGAPTSASAPTSMAPVTTENR